MAAGPIGMERLLTLIAALVALGVGVLLPSIGFYVGLSSQHAILQSEAEINGRQVSRLIADNPELWEVTTLRYAELLGRRPVDRTPEVRTLYNARGDVVAESADPLQPPFVERRMPVYDAGREVGQLRVKRSLRPLLIDTAWLALLGATLGGGVFVTLRTLPLRALNRSNERLRHEATHDALTALPNRTLFLDRLHKAIERSQRIQKPFAVAFLDLDRFKDINDSLGHAVGDEVLRHAAKEIVRCVQDSWSEAHRHDDGEFTVARMGGDEFILLLEREGSVADLSGLMERLLEQIAQPLHLGGHTLRAQASVGIAFHPSDGQDAGTLLRHADMAMYRAKERGRGTYHYFSEDLSQQTRHRIELQESLRGALERREFELHYQPKAELATGAVVGVEALLRWRRQGGPLVPPSEFIGLLESSRLIVPVGAWVIQAACAQLRAWDDAGLPPLSMAVNVSPRQFRDPDLAAHVQRVLQHTGIAPHRLELELTENLLMEDHHQSLEILSAIEAMGVRVAIDDFGTGYSSLAYLKRFRVDTLKLDRSFVQGLPQDRDSAAIALAVLGLAKNLGMEVVCEGVETAAQLAFLRANGFDLMQGFELGRPMPAAALAAWLSEQAGAAQAVTTPAQPDAARAPERLVANRS